MCFFKIIIFNSFIIPLKCRKHSRHSQVSMIWLICIVSSLNVLGAYPVVRRHRDHFEAPTSHPAEQSGWGSWYFLRLYVLSSNSLNVDFAFQPFRINESSSSWSPPLKFQALPVVEMILSSTVFNSLLTDEYLLQHQMHLLIALAWKSEAFENDRLHLNPNSVILISGKICLEVYRVEWFLYCVDCVVWVMQFCFRWNKAEYVLSGLCFCIRSSYIQYVQCALCDNVGGVVS